jgi:SAM-dependent methyltransferase
VSEVSYIQRLLDANPLREPILKSIIQTLKLPRGSHGLDVGCGIGLQSLLLAEVIGAEGTVCGVDILPDLLTYAERLALEAGCSRQVTFHPGDMRQLPFDTCSFDWVWSADCVGYPAGELAPILAELMRVVKPGGTIALLAWTSQQVLPGHALLEARLNATCSAYMPFLQDKPPEQQFLRGLSCFRQAGLVDISAQTFIGQIIAPLSNGERVGLASLFEMLWGSRQPETSEADWQAYQGLCRTESPGFILDIADYYAFFTYTLFRGNVPHA